MAFRNVAIPVLSGGALVLGYAAFSWLRKGRPGLATESRDALPAQSASQTVEQAPQRVAKPALEELDEASERVTMPGIGQLDFELGDEIAPESERFLDDAPAPEDVGALFLARVTDALSPFGGRRRGAIALATDPFGGNEMGWVGEASARAAHGENGFDPEEEQEDTVESKRRPTLS